MFFKSWGKKKNNSAPQRNDIMGLLRVDYCLHCASAAGEGPVSIDKLGGTPSGGGRGKTLGMPTFGSPMNMFS